MKSVKTNALRFLCFVLLTFFISRVFGQDTLVKMANTPIPGANSHGYLVYLPTGYDVNLSQKYPLLIFIPGTNSDGDGTDSNTGLDRMLENGTAYPQEQMMKHQWPTSYTVNGQTFSFLVFVPQFLTPFWQKTPTPGEMDSLINYVRDNYRVDTTRIYLMGNSDGAKPVWDYPGASSAYADRLAAILPFSGTAWPLQSKANNIKYSPLHVWAFHNDGDPIVPPSITTRFVKWINEPAGPGGADLAKLTLFHSTFHNANYDPMWRIFPSDGSLNIYQWMLQYSRTVTTARAGLDQEITLPVNSAQLNGSGTGPNGTISSYQWTQVLGPSSTAAISNPTSASATVGNLVEGNYVFRLRITDNSSASATNDIAINVNPAVFRIEGESFVNTPNVSIESTSDEGGGIAVGNIDPGDVLDYNVNIPIAGPHTVRFRLSSFYDNSQLQVKNANGDLLSTVNIENTHNFQNYLTTTDTITLPAGQQTIRLQSTGTGFWNINWMEIVQRSNSPVGTLPVNFVLFNANCNDGSINVLWKTDGEVNTKNFAVEKSQDGREWKQIASVQPAGQNSAHTYNYKDNTGANGLYRIVEYDIDGRRTYSSVIKSNCGEKQTFAVYPNPVVDNAIVNVSSEQATKLYLSVIDSKGAVVRRQEEVLLQGTSQLTLNMSGLTKGTYTLLAQWGNERQSAKLVKQ